MRTRPDHIGGGFSLGVNEGTLTESFSGMLPAGSYEFTVRLNVLVEEGGSYVFYNTANSGSFSIELVPAPGGASLLAVAGLAGMRRRRRA